MRILYIFLLWVSISLAVAAETSKTPTTKASKPKTAESETASKTTTAPKQPVKPTKAKSETTPSKSSKNAKPGENRGKRTLYDFGNAGYVFPNIASRRAGYVDDGRAYYPNTGYFNGQNAIAQFPTAFGAQHAQYPQYLEAPEPIIEIIIKDSNETLPTVEPQPIVTKKKKEKVHVFYVNYKKDENNKLHLESPIASLNNDDTEEEEEIVHYPAAVTPLPPVKGTTLRTIIHPDSEKYHSNSGIHVTFGSEDKSQSGHILEEHDAESIQSQVVAVPIASTPLHPLKADSISASTRADYPSVLQERTPVGNQLFTGPFQQPHGSQHFSVQQQLPAAHQTTYFRPPSSHLTRHQPQQQQYQNQYYQQKQQYTHPAQQQYSQRPVQPPPPPPTQPQAQPLYREPPPLSAAQAPTALPTPQQFHQQLQQQAQYYVNHHQQYQQQQTVQHNQFYQNLPAKPTQTYKQSVFFPTPPPKLQELPSRQPPVPYQPIKFRPTPVPSSQIKQVPIPVKLDNTNYQQQSQSQPQSQSQSQYVHHHQQQQHQQQHYHFNRQPQFVQQPTFSVSAPTLKSPNYYKSQTQSQSQPQSQTQPQSQFHTQSSQNNQFQPSQNNQFQSQYQTQTQYSQTQQKTQQLKKYQPKPQQPSLSPVDVRPPQGIGAVHNYFDIQPSKETELLKAIPKYEQHITETISNTGVQQHPQSDYNRFSYSTHNQVIHDIPAPNLGPTSQGQTQTQTQSSASSFASVNSPQGGHYITASSLGGQQQYDGFVTPTPAHANIHRNAYPSTTAAPPQYAESTDGQKIMIVTPVPAIAYNQYQSSAGSNQYNVQNEHSASSLQVQASTHFAQQPRQSNANVLSSVGSANSAAQFSVSTYHSDVFKELEQRQNQAHPQAEASQSSDNKPYIPTPPPTAAPTAASTAAEPVVSSTPPNVKASQTLLQLPDEVPEDLRQQLLSSGILNNADISVLDYDKQGDIALENLPAEHLQHFYGAGGGAQISESNQVLTVVKPNGEKVTLSEKELERVKETNSVPKQQNVDVKVIRFGAQNEKSVSDKYLKPDATVLPSVDLADRQYNRYLPLKINGAQFPIPDVDELRGKNVVSVVVLAPVEGQQGTSSESSSGRSDANGSESTKEVKFLGGDLIKTLVKKPTKENFKRWLEKEARIDVEQQSVVLLVTKSGAETEQEIFMYDIVTGSVSKLNGELSSAFVNVAEENASAEDLEHASTFDPSDLDSMMHKRRR